MLSLFLIFAIIMLMLGIVWWMEEGPERFQEPEPFAPVQPPRYYRTTRAGYKPSRRTHRRKEIQYR